MSWWLVTGNGKAACTIRAPTLSQYALIMFSHAL
eukprot:CAMPEP_0175129022 /NCGR_PEP_ID=MMETSP0087-20121206/5244_1 /TAXON_ID=136419 /ORGANISM="Unknown Unknown, Strain D1" /LENGTH=33 /DNA_ID= /DNA_START= /DNA_END= /DNA_ORIENTATION=